MRRATFWTTAGTLPTLAANKRTLRVDADRNDIVVFGPFFFSLPLIYLAR